MKLRNRLLVIAALPPAPSSSAILAIMTAEEREAQRRSFAYGNTAIENLRITREMVDEAADRLANEDAAP